ncbi:hypothetical protein P4V72_05230 [Bacillus thuringiensis]|uniref:Uncharacterized protein n=1 Tax=Bacillus thuringiensis TaxID=1428 RepID=A0A9W3XM43_BACTU|nr:hypothetical protein [Bacillus thuringiensis]AQY42460.1 hypothetical protein B4918_31650 [Bacillus thuringiensis]MDR4148593.1 hypothetical protein [Bacillus thuringiensis]MEC3569938.1 hypothetical protein [Bacillus thuringiensis]MED2022245.1 hypothetical protein [Bacillus thuringiensis]MED2140609.1 hypothetical protein [Bacillus thuringiensis]
MVKTACVSIITGILLICSTGCATQTDSITTKTQSIDDGTYTTKEITDAFPVGTPITTYIQKEDKLNVKHLTSITLTDGGVGRVLEATDGFVVVCGNEKGIFDVLIFKTMEDVKKYEQSLKR